MKPNTISLRRRHLMIAGVAGVAAPGIAFAGQFHERNAQAIADFAARSGMGEESMVVSGRILGGPAGEPLAGATVDVWYEDSRGDLATAATDGDGRFFMTLAPAGFPGRSRDLHYRVSHPAHATPVSQQLRFAPERGDLVAQLQRDDAGIWRTSFALTLA